MYVTLRYVTLLLEGQEVDRCLCRAITSWSSSSLGWILEGTVYKKSPAILTNEMARIALVRFDTSIGFEETKQWCISFGPTFTNECHSKTFDR